eukprot:GHVU01129185.1.p1 GENE.GHVU01129185.1~~GHVU01129185.1.p1  ORF type:complete len:135 (-),score=7.93 GHVU01129185.1:765-1169(-)
MKDTFFGHEFVVFPHYATHFTAYLFHKGGMCLYSLDSLPAESGKPTRSTVDLAKLLTASAGATVITKQLPIPRQQDGCSCGMYAVMSVSYAATLALAYVSSNSTMPSCWKGQLFWLHWTGTPVDARLVEIERVR